MEYINNFKTAVLSEGGQLQSLRLSITQQELNAHWESKTLAEMSQIFTINDDYIVNFIVSQLLPHYLSTRRVLYQAFVVTRTGDRGQELPLLYCYDCKIFRNPIYSMDENHFISAFMLCYRENLPIGESLYELVDAEALEANKWVLRVKESAIIKTYCSIQETLGRVANSSDRIVLPANRYYHFIQEWMKCYYNYNIEMTTNIFFKGLMILCQNQLLLDYYQTLTPAQREERMYSRPVKLFQRPKNVEQFTLTEEEDFGEISWQSLKIAAFRLKYKVVQQGGIYSCYRVKQAPLPGLSFQQLSHEDQCILYGFETLRKSEREYLDQYNQ